MQTEELNGSQIIRAVLERYGVTTVFSLAGGAHTYLLDSFDSNGINIVGSRHETACIASADGYARITRSLGVACIIETQGIPSSIAGLANALHSCSPVLVINSRLPERWDDAHTDVDYDKQLMLHDVCKWSRIVSSIDRLAEFTDAACKEALSGRPGPVVLTVPRDLYVESTTVDPQVTFSRPKISSPSPSLDDLKLLIDDLDKAKRPVIVAGAGAVFSNAGPELREISSNWNIPVVGKAQGRGIVAEDGILGASFGYATLALNQADFVIAIGTRMMTHENFGLPNLFSADAVFAKVDVDPVEVNRTRWVRHPIVADAKAFSKALLDRFNQGGLNAKKSWFQLALESRKSAVAKASSEVAGNLHPLAIVELVDGYVPRNRVVGIDGAYPLAWNNLMLKAYPEGRYIDHYPLGQMGTTTPLAIGAAYAVKEHGKKLNLEHVVLMTGDGSFGYYLTSLTEAVRAGVKMTIIVFNDSAWGSEFNSQVHMKIGRSINTQLGQQDFSLIGKGLGCDAYRVSTLQEFEHALKVAIKDDGITIIDAIIHVAQAMIQLKEPDLKTLGFNELKHESKLRQRE